MARALSLPLPSAVVLGKRKAPPNPRYLVSTATFVDSESPVSSEAEDFEDSDFSPSEKDDDDEDGEGTEESPSDHLQLQLQKSQEPGSSRQAASPNAKPTSGNRGLMLINGKLVPMTTKKRYQCTWDGCGKAYTKPTRLDEHERSHTHDRPFVCATCSKSYLRESHLNAHARSHQPESAKPFQCDVGGCSKRFWTKQHLQRHDDVHKGEKPFKCKEDGCQEAFTKHHQLRSHFAQAHCPEGTKNFVCEHSGCTKSFATSQKLENHAKVHKDKRYACTNSTCLSSGSAFFSKWSALQAHIREAHRPTCHHPDCNGRTFASTASLNMHEKIHEDAALEARVLGHLDDGVDNESENSERPQKRRRGGELGRDWKCDEEGCTKEFKSKKALTNHVNISHLGERKFACPRDGCSMTFGYKHVLQRHLSRHDAPSASASVSQKGGGKVKGKVSTIDIITGKHYANHTETKTIHCPWPDLFDVDPAKRALLETEGRDTCPHRFGRAYDLRRHLKAAHDFEVEADVLKIWVKGQHAATAKNISTDGGDGADGGDDLSA